MSHRLCQDPGKRNAGRSDNEELLQETFQKGSKCEADGSNLVRPEVRKKVSGWVSIFPHEGPEAPCVLRATGA